jgi:lambda family phage portal protein
MRREPFEAARDSESMGWDVFPYESSPDYELDVADTLITLRKRSRQLIKDNPIAAGAQQTIINSVGYPTKIDVASDSLRKPNNGIQERQINDFLTEQFKACDITGTKSLRKMLEEVVSWTFGDGDILINLPLDKEREGVQTVIELIEASRIKTPAEKVKDPNVRLGVEYYPRSGKIKGYWVKKSEKLDNFSDRLQDFDFFPMYKEYQGVRRKVTHLFKAPMNARPKASRQYPVLTPCMHRFKLLKDYEEAVIVGARVAACFSAFILSNNPAINQRSIIGDPPTGSESTSRKEKKIAKLKPGMVTFLKKDAQDVKFAAPNLPGDNVDKFRLREYKLISMYLRIPYEVLFLDLSEANYSSWKGATLEAKKATARWRNDLVEIIDWYVFTILSEAMIKGLIRGNTDYLKVRERWPSAGFIDPEKENRSNKLRLQNETASKQMLCEEEGNDYEEIQAEILKDALKSVERQALVLKRKMELEKEYGITFPENEEEESRDTYRREGEDGLDDDDKKERRKEDGNW